MTSAANRDVNGLRLVRRAVRRLVDTTRVGATKGTIDAAGSPSGVWICRDRTRVGRVYNKTR